MPERDPNWNGARIDGAGETPQLPKLGAAWVQPAPGSPCAGPMAYGATMFAGIEDQGLFGSTAGGSGGLAWRVVGSPGAGAAGLAGDFGGLRSGAFDSGPNPIGTLPSPVTVGISPESYDIPYEGTPQFGAEVSLVTPNGDREDELACLITLAARTAIAQYQSKGLYKASGQECLRKQQ